MDLRITYLISGAFEVMTYLVVDLASKEAMVIDPAGNLIRFKGIVEKEGLQVKYIVATHCHIDHILELKAFKESFGGLVCMNPLDHELLRTGYHSLFGDISEFQDINVELYLNEGVRLKLGKQEFLVLHTPGHTPGSICLFCNGNLFTGDTLFVGAVGRTDLKGGSFETLLSSIKEKILPLPDNTIIWPGHDYGDAPTSTVGREKRENPYITDFILP